MKSASSLALALAAVLILSPATTCAVTGNAADDELRDAVTRLQLVLAQQSETLRSLLKTKFFEPRCPYPFSNVMDECFFVSNFKLDWHEARLHCLGMGADLAMHTQLHALKTFVIQESFRAGSLWIGSTDEDIEGEWKWLDGEPIDEGLWAGGNPDSKKGNQHCLIMAVQQTPSLRNVACSLPSYFACHYKLEGEETI
ncbi:C-type lectin domain family 4 member M-like [Penaeus monodon]|uniref:C-type lectin domain family 4 member M-like n=1 Tax=Penaeus monodon TaxID=6687 RepID=UPI0018A7126D|nr:C-type lectin domain family 4 member M-like [Penaeus monodon]